MGYFVVLESSVDESFHLTLLPEFSFDETDHSTANFVDDIEIMLSGFEFNKGFEIVGKFEETFTTSEGLDVPVLIVNDEDGQLLKAHGILLYLADLYGAEFVNNDFVGEGYRAHISGADLTTELPIFDSVSLSKSINEGFEKEYVNFD